MARRTEEKNGRVAFTSATPLKLPGKQEALFREVLVFLEEAHRPYAIAGAFALRQHTGICRFTKDLDIFLRSEDTPETLAGLHRHRFECEICDPVWLAKAHRDGFFVDLITGMSNGVISVDASWIERAHRTQILGVETRVLAPEELVASKLFVTRRERFDGADLVHIIHATRGKLDWGRILELAGEHWELVLWNLVLFRYVYPAESGYVPQSLWQDLLGRFGAEVRVPDRHARFRGSLIDDATFAIDVAEWGLDDLFTESRARRPKIEAAPCASRV